MVGPRTMQAHSAALMLGACILILTYGFSMAAEQPSVPTIKANAAAPNQLHTERLSTQYLEVQKAAFEVLDDIPSGRTRVKVEVAQEDVVPTLPTITADLKKGLCHNVASAWKFLKGFALMQSEADAFNSQAAASGAPPLYPRPAVAHKAASYLDAVAFDLPDYLARAEAAGHQRSWMHTAPPNAMLIPHGKSFGAVADILSVAVGPARDDPTKSVATLELEVVHSPHVVSELQLHPLQTRAESAHFHFALPTGVQHDAPQLLSLVAGKGGLIQGLSIFMKGGVGNPCISLSEGAVCTPTAANPATGPCAPTYTCQREGSELHCRIKYLMAGTVCSVAKSFCTPARVCTGDSAPCPNTVAPNNLKCPYTDDDHMPMFMPLNADAKPAGAKPAGAKPADAKPVDAKPADTKPAGTPAAPVATARADYYPKPPYGGWPDCWGRCSAGACALDKTKPGCCYLNDKKDGYGGSYYAPYAETEGYAHYRPDPEREDPERHYTGHHVEEPREGYYNKGSNRREADLVCWGNAQA